MSAAGRQELTIGPFARSSIRCRGRWSGFQGGDSRERSRPGRGRSRCGRPPPYTSKAGRSVEPAGEEGREVFRQVLDDHHRHREIGRKAAREPPVRALGPPVEEPMTTALTVWSDGGAGRRPVGVSARLEVHGRADRWDRRPDLRNELVAEVFSSPLRRTSSVPPW